MNLQQLKHFVALIETGSFSKASEKVHLSQPALSRSIQALEEELGAALIDRIGKKNEPTELGLVVAERARKVLFEIENIRREAELQSTGSQGLVRLGLGAAPSALLSADLMSHLLNHYPKVKLKLVRGPTSTLLRLLREREIDAIVVHERTLSPDVRDLKISELPVLKSGFLCRSGHPLLTLASTPSLEDVRAYPILSTGLSAEGTKLLSDVGNPVHIESEDVPYLLKTVAQTDAILLGVQAFAAIAGPQDPLVPIVIKPAIKLSASFVVVELLGRTESTPMRIARQFCVSTFQKFAYYDSP